MELEHLILQATIQAPLWGSAFMGMAIALLGVPLFLRKEALIGETLSHATYPGIAIGGWIASLMGAEQAEDSPWLILWLSSCAGATAILGLQSVRWLFRRFGIAQDSALCAVLALFFGVGILIASFLQQSHSFWYKMVQLFLYGQSATMLFYEELLYLGLAVICAIFFTLCQGRLKLLLFDSAFAKAQGIEGKIEEGIESLLLVTAIVLGIRCVGAVLLAGMLIAPVVAGRCLSKKLSGLFISAALFGGISGWLGTYLSYMIPTLPQFSKAKLNGLPSGPLILLVATTIALLAVLFSPTQGLLIRYIRIIRFRRHCLEENLLKHLLHQEQFVETNSHDLKGWNRLPWLRLKMLTISLCWQGLLQKKEAHRFALTSNGRSRSERIVRLHRLWEVYLVYLGKGAEKVHRSAEEFEHILTPDLEEKLNQILNNPLVDPHAKPIPARRDLP